MGCASKREEREKPEKKTAAKEKEKRGRVLQLCGFDSKAKYCRNRLKFQYVVRETEGYELMVFVRREPSPNSLVAVKVFLLQTCLSTYVVRRR